DSCKDLEGIVKLQRQFLWGDTKKDSKIAWVSRKNVCKPKADGGLGGDFVLVEGCFFAWSTAKGVISETIPSLSPM
ncbi:hypothetical protein L195_g035495, partial [Trifolium pratense]